MVVPEMRWSQNTWRPFWHLPDKRESWNSLRVYFWKNSQDQLSFVPLSASGTEKRQFQPAKNPGQRFLMSSLDGAAIALTRPFPYFRLENKYCAKFTCAFRLYACAWYTSITEMRSTLDLYSGRKGQISTLQSQRQTQDRSVVARVRVYVLHAIYIVSMRAINIV